MRLFPAIDVLQGRAVRLLRGDYQQKTEYSGDPASVARDFAAQGASCLHTVDLDGAKAGKPENFEVIAGIRAAFPGFLQVGGGIRAEGDAARYLDVGVDRVIVGTAALKRPDTLKSMLARFGAEKIAVGVDARDGYVAVRGWLETSATRGADFCAALADMGVQTVVYTDIARDGALAGANLAAYAGLTAIPGLSVVASGGVSSAEDVRALRALGCAGAIVGKALYEGKAALAALLMAAEAGA